MTALPRLVVAAPASGHGKTTISTGVMAALTRRGYAVSGHKVGPDYIDPGYHALATGRPGRNLDPFMVGEERLAPLLLHGAAGADVAVIEGVMGLYDGQLGGDGFASTAHVAAVTQTPVVLVVDVSHASRSIAAVVHGMRTYDASVRIVGVILNKAGSPRHAKEVVDALASTGLPILGVLQRDDGIVAPSRHLGLVPAAERAGAAAQLDELAARIEATVDLDALLGLARTAPDLEDEPWDARAEVRSSDTTRPVVAMAGGRAFTFRYAETEELLRAAGCDVVTFDPLTARALPSGARALYLGGGFPETYASELSFNAELRKEIRAAVGDGMPTVAECAGLLYLCRKLDGRPMVGALEAEAVMTNRLTLGYRTAVTLGERLAARGGTSLRGHEFHRTMITPHAGIEPAFVIDGRIDGFGSRTLTASYLHLHWAGHPFIAERFADAARSFEPTYSVAAGGVSAAIAVSEPIADALAHHGDAEVGPGLLDFAVNVYAEGPPAWLTDALVSSVKQVGTYPNADEAEAALAALHGRESSEVLATAGAAEAFTLLARSRSWRCPVVIHPQFTEPEAALRAAGLAPTRVHSRPETGFALPVDDVPDDADLVLLGNPTNPTGVLHSAAAVRSLLRPGRVVVVDEAFIDGVPGEPESLARETFDGLLVVRSLTKLWGIPGVRAGYVVGDRELVASMRGQQPPWSISTTATAAMLAVATDAAKGEQERRSQTIAHDRDHLTRELDRIGIAHIAGEGAFVLAKVGRGTHAGLRDLGIAVRRCDTFPGLDDGWIRIAVRPAAQTDVLVAALARLTKERLQ